MHLRSDIIVSMSSTSSSDDNFPIQGGNSTSFNVPATSTEQVFTGQNVVTQITNQNVNTMISSVYTGPMLVYRLPLGYIPPVATTMAGPTPTWYLNPIYATHPMMVATSQFGLLIALINVPLHMVQPTMTLGLGSSCQNPASQNLVSQNLMSQIPMSQSVITIERLHMGETGLVLSNMT